MGKALYSFKRHPEHQARLGEWRDKWIENAMSTKPMDDQERALCRAAVKAIYAAAQMVPPPDHRIIFVASPFVARFAGGFAAGIWHAKTATFAATFAATYAATRAATEAATRDATQAATFAATYAATEDATIDATYAATEAATFAATEAATADATRDATEAATFAATYAATRDATYAATEAATRAATEAATADATIDATRAATEAATIDATYAATRDATQAATDAATRDATQAATQAATYAATEAATIDATYAATEAATFAATEAATADATRDATEAATFAATYAATRAATYAATVAATRAATEAATRDATQAATDAATRDATHAATENAMWYSGIGDMCGVARLFGNSAYLLGCAKETYRLWNGGNQWSSWAAYITFFRYVAELPIDYSQWAAYEILVTHAGPRVMHERFCLISDRPEVLLVDERNRPHCDDGPFCRWRDGAALYAIHGVRVPAWVVEFPERITVESIKKETNVEIRRMMRQRYGEGRYLTAIGARVIHRDKETARKGAAPRVLLEDDEGRRWLVGTDGSTTRVYYMEVDPRIETCSAAHESICGFPESNILNKS